MIEEEAKTKWCPFVRHDTAGQNPGSFNRTILSTDKTNLNCIGSACMAWRWNYPPAEEVDGLKVVEVHHDPSGSGYCGLAGKP